MVRVRYSHRTLTLKRPKVIHTKELDEETCDNASIWLGLKELLKKDQTLKPEIRECFEILTGYILLLNLRRNNGTHHSRCNTSEKVDVS